MGKRSCFECDSPGKHAHHVIPRVLGGTRTLWLCETCHGIIHGLDFTDHGLLIRVGMSKRMAEGKTTGVAPYGYKVDSEGYLIECPYEQAAVRQIHRLRGEGLSIRKIAAALEEDGFPARGGRWHKTTVERILKASA